MRKLTDPGRPSADEVSSLVQEARDAILRELSAPPYLIVLYGSETRGEATPQSDIDLLVVVDDATYEVMWNHDFSRLISVCIVSRPEFEYEREKGYSFVKNIEREGIVLWPAWTSQLCRLQAGGVA